MIIVLAAVLLSSPALSMTYFFQSDLGVDGFMRYCRYSNGKVYSVNSTDLCPMSIEEGGYSSGGMGFKKGEYQDGLTKVCIYDVLGEERALRLNSYELCPLSPRF